MKLLSLPDCVQIRLWLLLCALCASCASYDQKVAGVVGRYASGDMQGAAQQIQAGELEDGFASDRDGILILLQAAKILQDAGDYDGSAALFDRASAGLEHYDMTADVSVSEEFVALIGTQSSRAYRGTDYDRILLEVYQALNELGRGDLSEALVRVRRAYGRQAEAVARNSAEIAAREEDANEVGQTALDSAEFGAFENQVASLTSEAYADFVNPMATFLSAVLLREEGSNSNALVDLRKLIELQPRNTFLAPLLEEFEASEQPTPERIYVVFENGMAPQRQEWSLTLPTPNGLSRIAFPTIVPVPSQVDSMRIQDASGELDVTTQQIANIDSIVAADYQAHLASMIWRIIISTAAKETASYAVNKKEDTGLAFFATSLYKVMTSGADLRTWLTPGSEFELAVLQRPASGVLRLNYSGGSQPFDASISVEVPRARTTILFVRNPSFSTIVPHVFSIGLAPAASGAAPTP